MDVSKFWKWVDGAITRIANVIMGFCLAALFVLLVSQIVSRYFRIQALAPPDEITTLLFAWLVFISSALLMRRGEHLRVEIIDLFLEKRKHLLPWYNALLALLQLLFVVVFLRSALRFFIGSGTRVSPMLGLPQRYWYLAVLVSAVLMLIYTLLTLVTSFLPGRTEAPIDNVGDDWK